MINDSLDITHPIITIFLPVLSAYLLLITASAGRLARDRLQGQQQK